MWRPIAASKINRDSRVWPTVVDHRPLLVTGRSGFELLWRPTGPNPSEISKYCWCGPVQDFEFFSVLVRFSSRLLNFAGPGPVLGPVPNRSVLDQPVLVGGSLLKTTNHNSKSFWKKYSCQENKKIKRNISTTKHFSISVFRMYWVSKLFLIKLLSDDTNPIYKTPQEYWGHKLTCKNCKKRDIIDISSEEFLFPRPKSQQETN